DSANVATGALIGAVATKLFSASILVVGAMEPLTRTGGVTTGFFSVGSGGAGVMATAGAGGTDFVSSCNCRCEFKPTCCASCLELDKAGRSIVAIKHAAAALIPPYN